MTTTEDEELGGSVTRRSFLIAGTATALAATAVAAAPSAFAAPASAAAGRTGLRAGAGKAVIVIPSFPLDNFTTVHDDLYARVLLLETKARRVALVVFDLTSIGGDTNTAVRAAVTRATGVAAADVIITVTHTFSSPHVNNATFAANIAAAAGTAAAAAAAGLQPVTVGYGTGRADVNVNRNVETVDGYWLGTNESLPSDKSVGVMRLDGAGGTPVAVVVNYSVQSCVMQDSVMANGDLPVSADLAGATVSHVESQYPGATGFWLVGACGDQFPAFRSKRYTIDKDKHWTYGVDAHDAGFLLLTVQGERLGTEVVRVAQTIRTDSDSSLRLVIDSITVNTDNPGRAEGPTKTADFSVTGTTQAPAWVLRVGNGVIAGVEPELSVRTAEFIKAHSGFAHTFVASMFDGGAKNMPEKWDYDHVTYEAVDGSFAPGSAERVASRIVRTTRSLR